MKNLQRGFVVPVAIILAILLIAGVGVVYFKNEDKAGPDSQNNSHQTNQTSEVSAVVTNDETKDWQTYSNSEYGFEFKYPVNLVPLANNYASWGFEFQVCLFKSQPVLSRDCDLQPADANDKYRPRLQMMVAENNDKNRKFILENSKTSLSPQVVFFTQENGSYIFGFMSEDKTDQVLLKKIAATVKIIPKQYTVSQDWKTYKISELGFELRYPSYYGEFVKIDSATWQAENNPLPSKSATLTVKSHALTELLFRGIGYGSQLKFDSKKEQFYNFEHEEDKENEREYVEKSFSNGNLYMHTSSGEGSSEWWGRTELYFLFDKKNSKIISLRTSNNPNTYNKGPKLESIFDTLKFVQ